MSQQPYSPLPANALSCLPDHVQQSIRTLQQKLSRTTLQREWAFKEMIHLEGAVEDLMVELENSVALGNRAARRIRKLESDREELEDRVKELEELL